MPVHWRILAEFDPILQCHVLEFSALVIFKVITTVTCRLAFRLNHTRRCLVFRNHSCTSNFSCGNMAGMPLCCQHRTGACTRRKQGVPFFVRAPQV